ncbi:hypothetical protein, partial [Brucella endophytica]|uniref:hypothetical protein n=1 Tax=Brucella endophytica TaxID=1963359 RepID=UPI0035BBE9FE
SVVVLAGVTVIVPAPAVVDVSVIAPAIVLSLFLPGHGSVRTMRIAFDVGLLLRPMRTTLCHHCVC